MAITSTAAPTPISVYIIAWYGSPTLKCDASPRPACWVMYAISTNVATAMAASARRTVQPRRTGSDRRSTTSAMVRNQITNEVANLNGLTQTPTPSRRRGSRSKPGT